MSSCYLDPAGIEESFPNNISADMEQVLPGTEIGFLGSPQMCVLTCLLFETDVQINLIGSHGCNVNKMAVFSEAKEGFSAF